MAAPTILCPVDFSETSEGALRFALSLAAPLGARVRVVHVRQVRMHPLSENPAEVIEDESEADAVTQRELSSLAERHREQPVDVVREPLTGVVYQEIAREAERSGAQMIVMGTHGRTGLDHLLIGSVAERVVRLSSVPVCTVRKR